MSSLDANDSDLNGSFQGSLSEDQMTVFQHH